MRLILIILFLTIISPYQVLSQIDTSQISDSLRFGIFSDELDSLRLSKHIPGMAVAVVEDGKVLWSNGYGSSHFDTGDEAVFKAVTPDTPFWIASVTKPLVALLFLKLDDLGSIDLNDTINDMPGWSDFCGWLSTSTIVFGDDLQCNRPITVRNVLTHTVNGEPGSDFLYNPIMYSRLSRFIEFRYGNPISAAEGRHNTMAKLMQDHILGPAGMERTMASLWQREKAAVYFDMAQGFEYRDGAYGRKPHIERHLAGGAGVVSTVNDLARFDIALESGDLASESVMSQVFSPAVAPDGTTLPYAYGWYVQSYKGEKLIWHSGWDENAGFSALYLKVPNRNLTFIALANSEGMWWGNPLGKAQVENSSFANLFMEHFVFGD